MTLSRENLVALGAFISSVAIFLYWGVGHIDEHYGMFVLATAFGVFMAFNIGGNDVANSFGTSVGAKTLSIKQALVIAAIFEISGAMLAGGEVTKTIRKGIVNLDGVSFDPMLFVFVMMGALVAAGSWLLFASKKGLPVSTTHSIVGGIVGASLALGMVVSGPDVSPLGMINWEKIMMIALSWVLSPLLGGILSYAIYWYLKHYILDFNERKEKEINIAKVKITELRAELEKEGLSIAESKELEYQILKQKHITKKSNAFCSIRTHVPIVSAFATTIIAGMLLFKGLKKLHLDLSTIEISMLILAMSTLAYALSYSLVKVMRKDSPKKATIRVFSILQIFTASAFAFSHGANDIANAIGPFAAIIDILSTGEISTTSPVPTIAMFTFGVALIVGLWFIGKEVIATVGTRLAEIFPVTGFAAELGASAVILAATKLGIPVSSTHILIGAVLGIGVLNRNANWKLMQPIALAWMITLPVSALIAALVFVILKTAFGY